MVLKETAETKAKQASRVIPELRDPQEIPLGVSRVIRVIQDRQDLKGIRVRMDNRGDLVMR